MIKSMQKYSWVARNRFRLGGWVGLALSLAFGTLIMPAVSEADPVIDLMVVYTPAAKTNAGGANAINAQVDAAVAEANTVLFNSQAGASLRLVYRGEVTGYTEVGDGTNDLNNLQAGVSVPMAAVAALRSTYAADLVSMITASTASNTTGRSFLNDVADSSFSDYAFSLVKRSALTNGSYALIRELGRNLGCQYDLAYADATSHYPFDNYDYGYTFVGADTNTYSTVEVVGTNQSCGLFSNPNLTFDGVAAGTATNNNALCISNNAPTVAGFYTAMPLFQFLSNSLTLWENVGSVTVSVQRTGPTDVSKNVRVIYVPQTAGTNDYVAQSTLLTFAIGETNKTVSFSIVDDNLIESNETFQLVLTNNSSGTLLGPNTIITATIVESKAGLAWSNTAVTAVEPSPSATNVATVTLLRTGNTTLTNVVSWTTVDGTAIAGSNYLAASGTLTLAPGVQSTNVSVQVINDGLAQGTLQFTLALSTSDATAVLLNTNTTVTLLDSDAIFQFATNALSVSEAAGAANLTVLRIGATNISMTVNFATADGTATNGVRYTGTNGAVTFNPGVTTLTVPVPLINNSIIDGDQTFIAKLSNASTGVVGAVSNCVVTVQDKDIVIGWVVTNLTLLENAAATNLTVYRIGLPTATATNLVTYTFPTGTITNDFTAHSGTLTFLPGQTSKSVPFQPLPNNVIQTNRIVTVQLGVTPVAGVPVLANSNLVINLLESKAAVAWSATNAVASKPSLGVTTNVTLALVRTGNTNQTTQVSFTTVDGTAISNIVTGTDITTTNNYTGTNGLVTFVPGITNASVTVVLVGNGQVQGGLQFVVALSTNNTLVPSSNLVVNGTFSAGTNYWTSAGGDGNSGITPNGNPGNAYTNGTQNGLADFYQDIATVPGHNYVISFDVWNNPVDDYLEVFFGDVSLIVDPDTTNRFQTFSFYNQQATGLITRLDFSGYGNSGGDGWIIDNVQVQDAIVVVDPVTMLLNTNLPVNIVDNTTVFQFATNAVSVLETNTYARLTVLRLGNTNTSMTVDYTTTNGTANWGVRYKGATNGTLTFASGVTSQVVQVQLINDMLVNGDQTFVVKLFNAPTGQVWTISNCVVTVVDDDVEIGWAATNLTLLENAPVTSLNVYRRGVLTGTTLVSYTFPTGPIASDFIASSGILTFLPSETNKSVAFQPQLNDVIQTNRSVLVQLGVTPVAGVPYLGNSNLVITLVESKGGVAWSPASVTGQEPGTGASNLVTVLLTRTGNTNQTTQVIFDTVDGTAISNIFSLITVTNGSSTNFVYTLTTTNNYTATNGTVTFAPGITNASVQVSLVGNGVAQGTRQFNVRLRPAATNNLVVNGTFDTGIGSSWTALNGGVWDSSGHTFFNNNIVSNTGNFYQDLATVSGRTYTVQFDVKNESTNASYLEVFFGGVSLIMNPLTIGFQTFTFTQAATSSVTRINFSGYGNTTRWYLDNVQVLDPVLIAGTDPTTVLLNTNATVSVLDNEVLYQFAASTLNVSETNGTAALAVVRIGSTNNSSTINFDTADGSAVAGVRYTAIVNSQVVFAAGVLTQLVQVPLINDQLVNGNQTFVGSLSGGTLGVNPTCTVTVVDDDVAIGWAVTTLTMLENAAVTNLVVYRRGVTNGTQQVNYTFPTGTITNDFSASNGTLTFQPGQTNLTVAFQPRLNNVIQTNRTITVRLTVTPVAGVPYLENSNLVITLLEAKAGVAWSSTNSVVSEPAKGVTNLVALMLLRTGNTNQTTQVNFTTLNGSAISNIVNALTNSIITTTNNYTATNGVAIFAPGVTNLNVQVALVGNGVPQGDKLFTVQLFTSTLNSNNVVTNSDFEAGSNYWTLVTSDTNSTSGVAASGGNPGKAYFNGNTNSVNADLYQDLVTSTGHTYTVSFDVSMVQPTNSAVLQVLFGDTTILAAPVDTNSFTNYVYSQVATTAVTRIKFSGYGNTNGWFIDNVQVRDTTPFIGVDVNTVLLNTNDAVTVQDHDAVFQFTTNAVSASETNSTVTLTVLRSSSTNALVTVNYQTVDGTATQGVRYVATNGLLSFDVGVLTQTVNVTLINNARVYGNQAFRVVLSNASAGVVGTVSNCAVTVLEKDVEIGWVVTNLTLLEDSGTTSLAVYRSGVTNGTNTVSYTFPNGAIANDFVAHNGTLTFNPGDTTKLIPFAPQPTLVIQTNRAINVRLTVTPVAGVPYLGNTNLVITLVDSKAAVAWTPASAAQNKPALGVTNLVQLTLARTGYTNQTTQVSFTTADGSAISNIFVGASLTATNNYTATNGMVTFAPGVTNLNVQVAVVGNGRTEGSKLFTVVLSTNNTLIASTTNNLVANGTFDTGASWSTPATDTGISTNSGNPGGAYTNGSTNSVSADLYQDLTTIVGHSYSVSFDLKNASTNNDDLDVFFGNALLLTNVVTSGYQNFVFTQVATGTTTRINFRGYGNGDFWYLDNVQVQDVSGVVIVDPLTLLLNTNATVTVLDNLVSFQFLTNALSVSESNGTASVIVQRLGITNASMTVAYATADGTATNGVRYTTTTGTLVFAAGVVTQAVPVPLINNMKVDGNQTFRMTLSNASTGVVGTVSNCTVTILDDDVEIGWVATNRTLLENAAPTTLDVYRTGVTSVTSTVTYTFPTGTITNDFIASSGTLTFLPGVTSIGVPFQTRPNTVIQTNRTINVSLSVSPVAGVPYLGNTNLVISLLESKAGVAWRQTNVSWTEPTAGVTNWSTLSLVRTGNTNQTTQVSFTTMNGSAISNIVTGTTITTTNNYNSTNGMVTFAPGITNADVLISIVGNGRPEGSVLFTVVLSTNNTLVASTTSNLVINGTFATTTNGWTLAGGDGNNGCSLDTGNPAGSYSNGSAISADFYQDLATTPGHAYRISFDLQNADTNDDTAQVFFGDALLLDTTLAASFSPFVFTQTATTSVTRLNFSGAANTGCWYIDNVVVQDVANVVVVDPATVLLNTNVSVTVLDFDASFRFAATVLSVSETNGTVNLTVLRDGATNSSMTAGFATADGTASNGVRYIGVTGTVTFAAGVTSQVAQVTLINDVLVNGDQTFNVKLINPSSGVIGTASNCAVIVIDEDVAIGWVVTSLTLPENAGATNLIVYRTGVTTAINTVTYTFPTTGVITNDFSATSGTLTFLPGETNKSVAFQTLPNNVIQTNRAITVRLAVTNAVRGVPYLANTNLVITLTEYKAGMEWAATDVVTSEPNTDDTNTVTLTVMRVGNPGQTNIVTWATVDGTALSNVNYHAASGTLTFAPNVPSIDVSIGILNDGMAQGTLLFSVMLGTSDTNALLVNTNANVSILDADAQFQFATNALSVSETNGTAQVIVQRVGATNASMTVNYATVDGTASNGVRYTATNGMLTFAAGVVTQAVSVPLINNTRVDGNQIFTVILSNASYGAVGTVSNCAVTVLDKDVEIGWVATNLTLLENVGLTNLLVYRSGVTNGTNYVTYTFPNTGAITNDFSATSGTLTFLPGVTRTNVAFTTLPNNTIQTNRAINVRLAVTPVAGVPYLGNSNLVITLAESKAGLSWTSTAVSVQEPSATATNTVTLTVLRAGNTNQSSTVAWSTVDGTAKAGTNYLAASGTLTLDPGVQLTNVSVQVINDGLPTGTLLFTVALSNLDTSAAVLLNTNAIVSILDGSTMFQFTTNAVSLSETNAGVTLTVQRIGATNSSMTLQYSTADGTATQGVRYITTTGTLTFASGVVTQTMRVALTNNVHVDGDQWFTVVLSNASTGTLGTASNCTVTVIDDDVEIGWVSTNLTLLENAALTNLSVYRSGLTNGTNTVRYSFPTTGAITNDFSARGGTLTFLPGETLKTNVTFQPIPNNTIQTNRAVVATLAVTPVAGVPYLGNSNMVITLAEYKAGLSWTTTVVSVQEPLITATNTATLVVWRTGNTNQTNTVAWTTVDGTALSNVNYIAANGTLTLLPGVQSNTVSIQVINDSQVQGTLRFNVALSNVDTSASVLLNTNATVSVLDGQTAFQFMTNVVSVSEATGAVTLVVQRLGATNIAQTCTVHFATANGTATTNRYVATNGTLRFATGVATQGVRVVVKNNTKVDGDQTFIVSLDTASTGTVGTVSNCTVTIQDKDVEFGWVVTNLTMLSNADPTNLVVYRTGVTNTTNFVSYAFPTGASTNDFFSRSGVLTFIPGDTNKSVAFQPRPSNGFQTNRSVVVRLGVTPVAGVPYLGINSNLVIALQDYRAGLGWSTNAVAVAELSSNLTNNVSLWVKRTGNTNLTSTVAWATADGTATAGFDYVAANGTLTLDPGVLSNSVSIQIIGDGIAQGPQTFTVALSNLDSTASSVLLTNAIVTITDFDVVFQFTTNAVRASETNRNVSLIVRRFGSTNTSMQVGYATVDGTASNWFRYTGKTGILTFAANVVTQGLTVVITNNVRVDGDQTFSVNLNIINATGTLGAASNCYVTVLDNDVEIGWAVTNVALLENSGTTNLVVYRTGITNGTNLVTYTFPTSGAITNDFFARGGTLTFRPGETNKFVAFQPLPNNVIQTNRAVKVALSVTPVNGVPYLGLGKSNMVVTLLESKSGVAWSLTNTAWSSTNRLLSLTNTVVQEPAQGITNWVSLRLTRTGNTNQSTQVSFATADGTALSNLVLGTLTTNIIIDAATTNIDGDTGATNIVVDAATTNVIAGTLSVTNNYIGTNGMVTFDLYITNIDLLVGLVGNGVADGTRQFTVRLSTNNNLVATTTNNVVTNGTFDAGLAGWMLSNPAQYLTGWNDTNSTPPAAFRNGNFGGDSAQFYQDLTTILGHTYTVSFDVLNAAGDNYLEVFFGDASLLNTPNTGGVFTNYSYSLVATSTTTRLNFVGYNNTDYWYIDNVLVQDATRIVVADPVTVLLNTNATVAVLDNDVALQFATNAVSSSETNGFVTLTVQRTGATNMPVSVGYVTMDGTASNGFRYAATNGVLTFRSGIVTQAVRVALINNSAVDGNQAFTVALTNVVQTNVISGGVGTLSNCVVTVLDNDTHVGWGLTNLTLLSNSGSNLLTVYRTGVTNGTNVISYTFPTTSVTNGFSARSGSLTFKPGDTNKFVTFTPVQNAVLQTNRLVVVRLGMSSSSAGMSTYLDNSNLVITLVDVRAGLAWLTNAVSQAEPAAGQTNSVTLTVRSSGNTNQTNTVAWTTQDGTALAGVNYVADSGTLTFNPGQQTNNVTIQVIGDGLPTGNQQFVVALSSLDSSSVLLNTNATVTILDNDTTFQFATNAVRLSETNAAVVLTVRRSGNTNSSASVRFGTANGSATNGVRYVATNGILNFAVGIATQSMRVSLINNTVVDGDQAFTVALSNASQGSIGSGSNCTVTVVDNDVVIGWLVPSLSMFDNASATNLTIYRAGVTTGTNAVSYAFPTTGTITNDFRARNGTLTFLPGETNKSVLFQPWPNNVIQTNRLVAAKLTAVATAVAGVPYLSTSNLLITLMESKSGVAWSQTNSVVAEAASGTTNWLTLALTRSGNTNQTTQVSFTTADGSAFSNIIIGADITTTNNYTGTNGAVTFAVGVTNLSVQVALVGNGYPESNKQFRVILSTNNSLVVSSNLVVNGTFDTGTNFWSWTGSGTNNWSAANGNPGGAYQNASTASNSVDFYQDLATVSGQTYTVSFDVQSDTNDDYLEVFFGDVSLLTTPDTVGGYQHVTSTQVATSSTTRITFRGYDNTNSWFIDNVVVMDAAPVVVVDPVTVLLNTSSLVTVVNTDVAFQFVSGTATAYETNSTVKLWVQRLGATNLATSVDYTTVDGTATDGVRYVSNSSTLVFAPGVVTQAVTVAIINNGVVDGDQHFNVILGNPMGGVLGAPTNCDVTVRDNDVEIGWQVTALTVPKNAGLQQLAVYRRGVLGATNKVTYTFPTGTITNNFTANNGTLTFSPNDIVKYVAFTPRASTNLQTNVTVNVQLALVSPVNGVPYLANNNLAITLVESMATLSWATNAVIFAEPSVGVTNSMSLTVQRTGVTNQTNTVSWTTVNVSAQAGNNYVAASGTLTMMPGDLQQDVTIQVIGNGVAQGTLQFAVQLRNPDVNALVLPYSNVTVTVLDNDTSFQFTTNVLSVSETNGVALLTVRRTGSTNTSMSVDYATLDGTATNDVRYTQTSGTLTFDVGVSTQTVLVPIINNTVLDGNQSFSVQLSNPSDGALGLNSNCLVTVLDNDVEIGWLVTNLSMFDNAGLTNLVVYRAGTTNAASVVSYTFPGGSATNDFIATSGTLTFDPGVTRKNVAFTPRVNNLILTNHDVVVSLSLAAGVVPHLGNTNLVIRLVKSRGGVLFADTSVTEPIGPATNWVSVLLTRTGNTDLTNVVNWTTSNGTATAGVNYIATNGTLTLMPGMTETNVSIAILDDLSASTNEAFYVVLSTNNVVSPSPTVLLTNKAVVTIINSDATIQFASSSNSVVESTNAVLTVLRTGPTNSTVWVSYYTTNGSGVAGSDYVATNGTLTFAPGETSNTLTVAILNDSTMESNRTFTIVLTNASFGAALGSPSTNVVTVVDDDSVLSLVRTNITVSGGIGTMTVTVYRVGYTNNAVSVNYATQDGTASNGVNYNTSTGTLTFAAGATNGTIAVDILTGGSGNRIFQLVLSAPSTNATLSNTVETITIHYITANAIPHPALGVSELATPLRITGVQPSAKGQPCIQVTGANGTTFLLQATTNLADPNSWVTISTSTVDNLTLIIPDVTSNLPPARFYRLIPVQ